LDEFCTLFDSRYVARGLALYRSLERHCGDFRLHALCLDEEAERLLRRLDAPRLEVISLAELEALDRDFRATRDDRSRVEYYWTATPALCLLAFARNPELAAITYLDADLLFFDSPKELFAEFGDRSVLLVPHRWGPEHQRSEVSDGTMEEDYGTFNVEFMTFRRDPAGMAALQWWYERCLESCPALVHPGRFGDQKYLDDWPQRFEGVHVLQHPGGGLAPWNVSRYRVEANADRVLVDGRPLVFHHYQGLWLHVPTRFGKLLAQWSSRYRRTRTPPSWVWATRWPLSEQVLDLVWEPYVERLAEAMQELTALGADPRLGTDQLSPGVVGARFVKRHLPRRMRRTYWRVRRAARDADSLPAGVGSELA